MDALVDLASSGAAAAQDSIDGIFAALDEVKCSSPTQPRHTAHAPGSQVPLGNGEEGADAQLEAPAAAEEAEEPEAPAEAEPEPEVAAPAPASKKALPTPLKAGIAASAKARASSRGPQKVWLVLLPSSR